jgi:hypothetical protein
MGKEQPEEINELKMNVHGLNREHCSSFCVILHKPEPFCILFSIENSALGSPDYGALLRTRCAYLTAHRLPEGPIPVCPGS